MADYHDRWITCTPEQIQVRCYYFPYGTKKIPYGKIRSLRRVEMGPLTGRGRIWGTANFRYWASLDPKRGGKRAALILDLGRFVHPYLTPDDPDAVEAIIRAHAKLPPESAARDRGPLI